MSNNPSSYDLIVIGAGPGGYVAAIKAAQCGMKTALIERAEVGGTCLNRGCIPTKTLLHTASLLAELKNAAAFGLVAGHTDVDIVKLYARKNNVVQTLRGGIEELLSANGVKLFRGRAFVPESGKVRIADTDLNARNILIATGGTPALLSLPGADLPGVLSSDDILSGEGQLYKRLLIIGGGVIGVEFASIFHAFGAEVTIIEALERVLPNMDREISQNLQMIFKRRGIRIQTSAQVRSIERSDDGMICAYVSRDNEERVCGDAILMSVGRRANTDGLFAESLGIAMQRGMIETDARHETSAKGIYAIGDVALGSIQLAHAASAQGINAVLAMNGREPEIDMGTIPSCIYTTPEIASVGITADDAKHRGIPVQVGKFVMSANGKNLIEMADRGFVKLVFHGERDVLLGAQLMCPRATDIVGELALAVANGLTREQVARTMRAHPTFEEAVGEAAEDAAGQAVHIMPKKKPSA